MGAVTGRGGPLWLGRRLRFYLRDGEVLQPARCVAEFGPVDVCGGGVPYSAMLRFQALQRKSRPKSTTAA